MRNRVCHTLSEKVMKMFEEQKWSKTLKEEAEKFIHEMVDPFDVSDFIIRKVVELIEMAMEEARDEMRETVGDWYEPEPRDWGDDER